MSLKKENNAKLGIHIEGLQVILSVKDMAASRAFYIDILGFKPQSIIHGLWKCMWKIPTVMYYDLEQIPIIINPFQTINNTVYMLSISFKLFIFL